MSSGVLLTRTSNGVRHSGEDRKSNQKNEGSAAASIEDGFLFGGVGDQLFLRLAVLGAAIEEAFGGDHDARAFDRAVDIAPAAPDGGRQADTHLVDD